MRLKLADPHDLYATDLHAWAETQVRALQEGRLRELDRAHLADVMADLAASEVRLVTEHLRVILTGLLRWSEQVDLRCHGWAATIDQHRDRLDGLFHDSPSLRAKLPALIAEAYPAAKKQAVLESALFDESYPEGCPFTDEEIMTIGYLPDPYGDDAIRGEGWWKRSAS